MENQNSNLENITNNNCDDIIIQQEPAEIVIDSQPNDNATNYQENIQNLYSEKMSLESCLMNNGIFIPEDKFITEIYFKNEATKDIEAYIADIMSAAFKQDRLNFVAINAAFFRKNTEYRKIMHSIIDERHSDFKSLSAGYKDYIMICRKNKFLEFLVSVPKDEMQNALDFIFLKLYSFNMRENSQENLDKEEIDELYEKNEDEAIDELEYQELQKKKMKKLKELAEEEERNKHIYLPVFKKCQVFDIKDSSVSVRLPEVLFESLIEKNKTNIRGFRRIYENTKYYYVAYILDTNSDSKKFKEWAISESSTFTISNLQSDAYHLIKFSLKFDKYYSKPSKNFIFCTKRKEIIDPKSVIGYITWGNNKNNRLLVNKDNLDKEYNKSLNNSMRDSTELINLVNDDFSKIDINSQDINLIQPSRLNSTKVIDFSTFNDVTYILLSNGEIVSSGKTFAKSKINSEELDLDFEESKAEECSIYYVDPYTTPLPWGIHVRKVGCGLDFCVCLDIEGNLFSWGMNDFGQLGQNLPKDAIVNNPRRLKINYENSEENVYVTDVQVGYKHCLASAYINERIKLFSWGFGQGFEPIVKAEDYALKGMKLDERILKISNSFSPLMVKFSNTDRLIKIIAGFNQNAIICKQTVHDEEDTINVIYTFGETSNLQLGYVQNFFNSIPYWGIPTRIDFFLENSLSVLDVAYSDSHSLFLVKNKNTGNNEVYCCGNNYNLKCGMAEKIIKTPTKMMLTLSEENNSVLESRPFNPIKISAGKNHSLILCSNNVLLIIGKNNLPVTKSSNPHKNLIHKVEDLELKSTDEVIKIDCFDDNISLLLKSSLN